MFGAFLFIHISGYLPLNKDTIHTRIPITTITAIIPTAAPALNMPPITEHPLSANSTIAKNNKFNFFMVYDRLVDNTN